MWKLFALLLLRKEKRICKVVEIWGQIYIVKIEPYVSITDLLKKAASRGVLTANEITDEDVADQA